MLKYKGYSANLEIDADEQVIYGTVLDLQDVIHFEGETVAEATQAFEDSVDEYLDYCNEIGRTPEKPFSGHFTVRTSPELHRKIYIAATEANLSLNAYIEATLSKDA